MSLLETVKLNRSFGGVVAVNDVDFYAEEGMITGLIGPNGAGKTTLFNNITGLDKPSSGKVIFQQKDITGLSSYKIARKGISRTFQNIRLFKELTVLENVLVGLHFKVGSNIRFLAALNSFFLQKKERISMIKTAYETLEFLNLDSYANQLASNLAYGQQRYLEIARAIVSKPKLLFLDEPAAGMNPHETQELSQVIKKIRDLGISVVLIEHDMKLVMSICDNIFVLNYGNKIASGTANEIKSNPDVIKAYLGGDEDND